MPEVVINPPLDSKCVWCGAPGEGPSFNDTISGSNGPAVDLECPKCHRQWGPAALAGSGTPPVAACPCCGVQDGELHKADCMYGCATYDPVKVHPSQASYAEFRDELLKECAASMSLPRRLLSEPPEAVLARDESLRYLYATNVIVSVCLHNWVHSGASFEQALRSAVIALAKQNVLLQRQLTEALERQSVVYLMPPP